MLGLSLNLRIETNQLIEICGGATGSIFPNVEALLSETDYQSALEYVAARKNMYVYRSMVDFLFCELHPKWRGSCMRFYLGSGPQLKELLGFEQIEDFDKKLTIALTVARTLLCEQRCKSWSRYRYEVKKVLQAAA